MPRFEPFHALRFVDSGNLGAYCAPPYDVLSDYDRQQLAAQSAHNIVHIDLPIAVPPSDAYANASHLLQSWIENDVLQRDDEPSLTLYRTSFTDETGKSRNIVGVIGALEVVDENAGGVLPHEQTTPKAKTDRLDLTRATDANLSPVWGLSTKIGLSALLTEPGEPVGSIIDVEGVIHSVERIVDKTRIEAICAAVSSSPVVIADGHHRAASAAKVADQLPDSDDAKFFLTTLFPANQLAILDYNRVVKDLNGHSDGDLLSALQDDFTLTRETEPVKPAHPHEFGMYLNKNWYRLQARPGTWTEDPIGVLDVSILSERVLNKLLGVRDQRTDKRIDFVGGIRGLNELVKRVDGGEMAIAFSLYPVSIHQLFDIADSGSVMPPKSTWFEPKLRDGLLTHRI